MVLAAGLGTSEDSQKSLLLVYSLSESLRDPDHALTQCLEAIFGFPNDGPLPRFFYRCRAVPPAVTYFRTQPTLHSSSSSMSSRKTDGSQLTCASVVSMLSAAGRRDMQRLSARGDARLAFGRMPGPVVWGSGNDTEETEVDGRERRARRSWSGNAHAHIHAEAVLPDKLRHVYPECLCVAMCGDAVPVSRASTARKTRSAS